MAAVKRKGQKPPAEDRTISLLTGKTSLEERAEAAEAEATENATLKTQLGPMDFHADSVKIFSSGKPTKDWGTYQFTLAEWNGGYVLYAVGGITDTGYPVKFSSVKYSLQSLSNLKKLLVEVLGG